MRLLRGEPKVGNIQAPAVVDEGDPRTGLADATPGVVVADLGHVDIDDAKTKPPTWHAKCRRDLSKGNLPKP